MERLCSCGSREELTGLGLVAVDELGRGHPALVFGLELEDRHVAVGAGDPEGLLLDREDRAGTVIGLLRVAAAADLPDDDALLASEEREGARIGDEGADEVLDLLGGLSP